MPRVAILGASGYTALELCKLLARHPQAEITALVSQSNADKTIGEVHPILAGVVDVRCENIAPREIAQRADCVFGCLPHGTSAAIIRELLSHGVRVVDFSADYRLNDPADYAQWYVLEHPDPQHLGEAAYGLTELNRDAVRTAQLVANPGCYPTSAILGLAPLLTAGLIAADGIIVDSKSGVSGAGRNPKPHLHFPECNESVAAYGVGAHRHTPEINQELTKAARRNQSVSDGTQQVEVIFTPHLIPMDRGILSTCYASAATESLSDSQILDALRQAYEGEPFVRVVDHLPATKHVSGTNFCDITARIVSGRVIVISAIDNLIKGAAGAAVQNFNVMFELPETTALK